MTQYIGGVSVHKNKFGFCLYKDDQLIFSTNKKKDWKLISQLMEAMGIKVYTENELIEILKINMTPEFKKKMQERYSDLMDQGFVIDELIR